MSETNNYDFGYIAGAIDGILTNAMLKKFLSSSAFQHAMADGQLTGTSYGKYSTFMLKLLDSGCPSVMSYVIRGITGFSYTPKDGFVVTHFTGFFFTISEHGLVTLMSKNFKTVDTLALGYPFVAGAFDMAKSIGKGFSFEKPEPEDSVKRYRAV